MITTTVWTYAAYLVLSVGVTAWVGRTLRKNGPTFVTDGDDGKRGEYVSALTHLLVVGFYLVNFGVISLVLRYGSQVTDVQSAVEHVSTKVGGVLLVLGAMHFVIVASLAGARNRGKQDTLREQHWGRTGAHHS